MAQKKVAAGGYMVLRPDSGDPVEVVLAGLEAGEKVFGVDVNAKGYKTPRGGDRMIAMEPLTDQRLVLSTVAGRKPFDHGFDLSGFMWRRRGSGHAERGSHNTEVTLY